MFSENTVFSTPPPEPLIVMPRMALPVPETLVAVRVVFVVPVAVGMPEIRPVEEFTVRPGGRFAAP